MAPGLCENCASPLTVGITGGAGSGKTTVSRRFGELGATVISADHLARRVVQPGMPAYAGIVEAFGSDVLGPDGRLNRKLLRETILGDVDARRRLERILHPEIIRCMRADMQAAVRSGAIMVVVEVPLLFELDLAHLFRVVVTVNTGSGRQIRRLMQRDGVTETEARQLLSVQMSSEDKIKRSDHVIPNHGSLEKLRQHVDRLFEKLKKGCKSA